ncbi:hypothetical protein DGG96_16815 [Legionella qingyii]|uniref:Uncharacterized protein n=1 Tax=Legionella qingyii TaxID=2184757 RepID=A0A317U117_9GAMM|nr:hypothetical protein DGG96_16815 [Legionella qingyii]
MKQRKSFRVFDCQVLDGRTFKDREKALIKKRFINSAGENDYFPLIRKDSLLLVILQTKDNRFHTNLDVIRD